MCLYLHTDAMLARTDITVYKVILIKDNTSLYTLFQYSPKSTYKLGKRMKRVPFGIGGSRDHIEEGFHSYIHFLTAMLKVKYDSGTKVVKFIIPKGATYYQGEDGYGDACYVSDSIISESLEAIKDNP